MPDLLFKKWPCLRRNRPRPTLPWKSR